MQVTVLGEFALLETIVAAKQYGIATTGIGRLLRCSYGRSDDNWTCLGDASSPRQ
jgi:hypothetical protein